MGTLTDLLALFPEGVDQVPHGAVAKALLSVPSRSRKNEHIFAFCLR